MKLAGMIITLLAAAGLAGCFTSDDPFITPDKAVFPYQKIVWQEADGKAPVTMVHDGDAYRFRPEGAESDGFLKLMKLDDLYLAQLEFQEGDETNRLYAVLKVDPAGKTVQSYAAVAPENAEELGFRDCSDASCIDNFDDYVAYAKRLITDGRPPDQTYTIISTE